MSRFLIGFAVPLFAALGALVWFERVFFLHDVENIAWLGAMLIGAPISAAIMACVLAQLLRRPRCLDATQSGIINPSLRGVIAGSATIASVLLVMSAFAAHRYSDILLLAMPAGLFALVSVLTSRRIHAGGCGACGYDIEGIQSDRCPECGVAISVSPNRGRVSAY